MAFTSALRKRQIAGRYKWKWYTFTSSGGGTGGVVETGLKCIVWAGPTCETTEAGTNIKVERDTNAGGANLGSVQITTVADEVGTLLVIGR